MITNFLGDDLFTILNSLDVFIYNFVSLFLYYIWNFLSTTLLS